MMVGRVAPRASLRVEFGVHGVPALPLSEARPPGFWLARVAWRAVTRRHLT